MNINWNNEILNLEKELQETGLNFGEKHLHLRVELNKDDISVWIFGVLCFKQVHRKNRFTYSAPVKKFDIIFKDDAENYIDRTKTSVFFDRELLHLTNDATPKSMFSRFYDYAFNNSVGESFGCCSRYMECSNARACVHKDFIFAKDCIYQKNLLAGRIFYGVNRNID